ncbi:Sugct [Symbiodinium necroappetens]|uniref:Sugct protein n=1 Tax=Symbiodinium necroappetens TaxID=1628268 RepID=A0A812IND0_9DINO|nr:Sugct [Symbiodinium necroappetens]
MSRGNGGAIVAVSSIAGHLTHRNLGQYCVAKAGVEMLVRNSADELGHYGIRVNGVRPGLVPTEMAAGLQQTDAVREDYLAQMPLKRLGKPEDVAAAVRFLAGPEAAWITGQLLGVDGGHSLRRGPDLDAIFAPTADAQLADLMRPTVIKVEAFDGDIMRHTQKSVDGFTTTFVASNRGKKGIAIDLKHKSGNEMIKRFVPYVDVVVQNFRPGAVERMGLDYDTLKQVNPSIVYCSISGFGNKGPYINKRIYDPIIQGMSGLNAVQGGPGQRPEMIKTLIPDVVTALTAAQAITAALLARERSGQGQHVTVAMIDAMIALIWPSMMANNMRVDENGENPPPTGTARRGELIFRTTDGYITAAAVSEAEWQGLCTALDKAEWLNHDRLNTPAGRVANSATLIELLSPIFEQQASAHWLKLFDEHDVPCGPILTPADLPNNEQIIANELIEVFDHPGIGKIRQARPAAKFSATPAHIQGPAPGIGEHTRAILQQFDFSDPEIDDLYAQGVVR